MHPRRTNTGNCGLQVRAYFRRYTEDALDLCDVFGSRRMLAQSCRRSGFAAARRRQTGAFSCGPRCSRCSLGRRPSRPRRCGAPSQIWRSGTATADAGLATDRRPPPGPEPGGFKRRARRLAHPPNTRPEEEKAAADLLVAFQFNQQAYVETLRRRYSSVASPSCRTKSLLPCRSPECEARAAPSIEIRDASCCLHRLGTPRMRGYRCGGLRAPDNWRDPSRTPGLQIGSPVAFPFSLPAPSDQ